MMGQIYLTASRVRVWLGPAEDDSDIAMDFLMARERTARHRDPAEALDCDITKFAKRFGEKYNHSASDAVNFYRTLL